MPSRIASAMKLSNILCFVFLVGLLAVKAAASDTPSSTADDDYRKSMELYRANEEAYHNQLEANERTRQAFAVIGGVVVVGLVILVLVPAWRQQKALMAISAQNQKILEEIRELLKKNAGDPNKLATTSASAADRLRAQVTAASHLSRLVK
jgi:preprotein translocase subunit SecG